MLCLTGTAGNGGMMASFIKLCIAAILVACASPAFAQATRTWVSGVGDDVNPCSRTAPCKTFAGAISKTAAGGEINCLDPGGFGAVTITKSITITCHYTEGGNLAAGNGIVVNAAAGDVVVLRGLDIFGVNPPLNGVRFLNGAALHIEDSTIRRFNGANSFGISFQPSGIATLFVARTTISHNGSGATGGGINIQPTGTGIARAVIKDSLIRGNANLGISINSTGNSGAGIAVVVENSEVSGTSGTGIAALQPAGTAVIIGTVTNSLIAHNSGSGLRADGASATFRVANTTITGNAFAGGSGVQLLNSGRAHTYLDNRLDGNAIDGAFTAPALPKE